MNILPYLPLFAILSVPQSNISLESVFYYTVIALIGIFCAIAAMIDTRRVK